MTATYKDEITYNQVIDECFCNKCNKSMKKYSDFYGMIEYEHCGSYGSNPLNDQVSYIFSLCENCLAEMFLEFKTPPKIFDRHDRSATWKDESDNIKYNIIKNVLE